MMSGLYGINQERLAKHDFSYPIGEFRTVLVFAKPKVTDFQWAMRIFDVFQPSTYLLLFGSAILLLLFLAMIDVHFYGYSNPIILLSRFQSIQIVLKAARSPLLLSFNFLIIISIGLYESLLLPQLFLHPTPEVMDSEKFLQRLEDKTFTLVFQNLNPHSLEQIRQTSLPFFQRIQASFRTNPYLVSSNWSTVYSMLESGRFVTFADEIPVKNSC